MRSEGFGQKKRPRSRGISGWHPLSVSQAKHGLGDRSSACNIPTEKAEDSVQAAPLVVETAGSAMGRAMGPKMDGLTA